MDKNFFNTHYYSDVSVQILTQQWYKDLFQKVAIMLY